MEWLTIGTDQRQASLTVNTINTNSSPMLLVDNLPYGSLDATVLPTHSKYVDNPHNVQATQISPSSVQISWDPVPGGSNAYVVYYGNKSRFLPLFNGYTDHKIVLSGTSIQIDGLELEEQAYYFTVVSSDTLGGVESLYSAEVIAGSIQRLLNIFLPLVQH